MRLASPAGAILSAVIFNALIIVALIPLALRGVQLPAARGGGAAAPLRCSSTASERRRRPVPRDQGIDMILLALGLGASLKWSSWETTAQVAIRIGGADNGRPAGAGLPARDHRRRAGAVPKQANGSLLRVGDRLHRLRADRAAFTPPVTPTTPLGGRRWRLRRHRLRRIEPRTDQSRRLRRPRSGRASRELDQAQNPGRTPGDDPGGARDHLRERPRPDTSPGDRATAGGAGRQRGA